MDDDEIEAIHDHAIAAARDDWHPGKTPNPHPVGSEQASFWDYAYRNAYAQANGR